MKSVNRSSEPNTDGMQLPYRPINTTTLSVVKDLKYVSTDFAARWISHSYTNEANTQSLSPYTVWDAGLTKTVNVSSGKTSLTFRTEIRNLFNKSYRIIEKAPVPLREIWIIISLEQTAN
jgi:outer membrane cobalamin receptor